MGRGRGRARGSRPLSRGGPRHRLHSATAILILIAALAAKLAAIVAMYRVETDVPLVRRARVAMLEPGARPLTLVLLSDIHVARPDMPPARVARLVARVNALRPDLVLFAGDFISQMRLATRHYSTRVATAPLAGLRPPLGTIAVLGNRDHYPDGYGAVAALEAAAGVRVLMNERAELAGLGIGGLDDWKTQHTRIGRAFAGVSAAGGPVIVLTHDPDVFRSCPPPPALLLAGHTHCGQIGLSLIGPITYGPTAGGATAVLTSARTGATSS